MAKKPVLLYEKLSEHAGDITRPDEDNAGYDLPSAENCIILPNTRRLITTDIRILMPPGTYGRIASRSGLARDYGICVLTGVIDRGFHGAIHILLYNTGSQPFHVKRGYRIAQLVLERYVDAEIKETMTIDNSGKRQEHCFGSSGL